jgi:hypothetical protein
MRFSIWNQHWEHKEIVNLSPGQVYKGLLEHYMQSSKSLTLDSENFSQGFSFNRGNVILSVLAFGSELWCKHYVDIEIKEIEEGKTQIYWKINLKLCGLQAGKNAIIEECKKVVKKIS